MDAERRGDNGILSHDNKMSRQIFLCAKIHKHFTSNEEKMKHDSLKGLHSNTNNMKELCLEYTQNVDPVITPVIAPFSFDIHDSVSSSCVHLLPPHHTTTSPTLDAFYVKVVKDNNIQLKESCTSRVLYVIQGSGYIRASQQNVMWNFHEGDVLVVYGGESCTLSTNAECLVYYVNDEPLLKYLGVAPTHMTFQPLHFSSSVLEQRLCEIRAESEPTHNRCGVLLANPMTLETTKTITPIMWSLFNVVPAQSHQRPHRHNSVALDLCVRGGSPEVYTLMGKELDNDGWIKDPIKVEWTDGGVFLTPPGWWHSHHNNSDFDAVVFPVQDAGLFLYQRTLDIQFSTEEDDKTTFESDVESYTDFVPYYQENTIKKTKSFVPLSCTIM